MWQKAQRSERVDSDGVCSLPVISYTNGRGAGQEEGRKSAVGFTGIACIANKRAPHHCSKVRQCIPHHYDYVVYPTFCSFWVVNNWAQSLVERVLTSNKALTALADVSTVASSERGPNPIGLRADTTPQPQSNANKRCCTPTRDDQAYATARWTS